MGQGLSPGGFGTFRLGVENSPGGNRSLYTAGTVGTPTFRPGVENSMERGASTYCLSSKHEQLSSSSLTPSPQRSRHSQRFPQDCHEEKDDYEWQQRAEEARNDVRGMDSPRPISSNSSRLLLLVQDGVLNQEQYECALVDIETQFVTEFPGARPLWISGLSVRERAPTPRQPTG